MIPFSNVCNLFSIFNISCCVATVLPIFVFDLLLFNGALVVPLPVDAERVVVFCLVDVDNDSAIDLIAAISLVTLFSIPNNLSSKPSIALANS